MKKYKTNYGVATPNKIKKVAKYVGISALCFLQTGVMGTAVQLHATTINYDKTPYTYTEASGYEQTDDYYHTVLGKLKELKYTDFNQQLTEQVNDIKTYTEEAYFDNILHMNYNGGQYIVFHLGGLDYRYLNSIQQILTDAMTNDAKDFNAKKIQDNMSVIEQIKVELSKGDTDLQNFENNNPNPTHQQKIDFINKLQNDIKPIINNLLKQINVNVINDNILLNRTTGENTKGVLSKWIVDGKTPTYRFQALIADSRIIPGNNPLDNNGVPYRFQTQDPATIELFTAIDKLSDDIKQPNSANDVRTDLQKIESVLASQSLKRDMGRTRTGEGNDFHKPTPTSGWEINNPIETRYKSFTVLDDDMVKQIRTQIGNLLKLDTSSLQHQIDNKDKNLLISKDYILDSVKLDLQDSGNEHLVSLQTKGNAQLSHNDGTIVGLQSLTQAYGEKGEVVKTQFGIDIPIETKADVRYVLTSDTYMQIDKGFEYVQDAKQKDVPKPPVAPQPPKIDVPVPPKVEHPQEPKLPIITPPEQPKQEIPTPKAPDQHKGSVREGTPTPTPTKTPEVEHKVIIDHKLKVDHKLVIDHKTQIDKKLELPKPTTPSIPNTNTTITPTTTTPDTNQEICSQDSYGHWHKTGHRGYVKDIECEGTTAGQAPRGAVNNPTTLFSILGLGLISISTGLLLKFKRQK